jgi:hypothetical protein
MELEHMVLSDYPGAESQRLYVYFHMWNIDPLQILALLWKAGHMKKSSHIREGG